MKESDFSQAVLHESTVTDIRMSGFGITIDLDNVSFDGRVTDENRYPVSVTISGVKSILRDSIQVESIDMEMEGGEVLTLKQDGNDAVFIVIWNDFSENKSLTVAYDFVGGVMSLQLL